MEQFTNPFLLPAGARFSWRQKDVGTTELRAFQERAGEWLGAHRELGRRMGTPARALMPRLALTYGSSHEEAAAAGERVAEELGLGVVPSKRLAQVMEAELGILVLMVDAIEGVSGAACTLPGLDAVLVNRKDAAPRRNFDLAHELFHLLTWDTMPPEWADGEVRGDTGKAATQATRIARIERLADKFASALLMPSVALDGLGTPPANDMPRWLVAGATKLGVSGSTLKWQLVNTGRIAKSFGAIPDAELRNSRTRQNQQPTLFGRRFMTRIAEGIAEGHISSRRAAALAGVTVEELGELCMAHSVALPVELGGKPKYG